MQGFLKKKTAQKTGILPINETLHYSYSINIRIYSVELTATEITVRIKLKTISFTYEGRSVSASTCTGDPLTSLECNPVLSHVRSGSFEKPTQLEVLHEGAAFNTLG